ncbi:MAG TPA: CotH kinase family protein, partial [Bacillota bacterium]|nr:CotH kinase family protein [Bacillota bacterium]
YRKTYALKTNENVLHPDFSSFTDFIGLVNDLDVSSYYDSLSQSLDTDAFARALAMGFLVGSADDIRSDANNYYMYFNNGGAYYIPFDEDNALGYGWNPYGDYGISLDITGVELAQSYNVASDYVLVYNLMNDPDFIDLYLGYLDSYTETDGLFNYDSYEAEYLLIKSLYETEIIETSPLGIQLFDPDMRDMPVSSYYSLKISSVRTQLEDLVG